MLQHYGGACTGKRKLCEWVALTNGQTSSHDKECSSCPSMTFTDENVGHGNTIKVHVQTSTVFLTRYTRWRGESSWCASSLGTKPGCITMSLKAGGSLQTVIYCPPCHLNHPPVRSFSLFSGIWMDQFWITNMKRMTLWIVPVTAWCWRRSWN